MRTATTAVLHRSSLAAGAFAAHLHATVPVVQNWGRAMVPAWRPTFPTTRKEQMVWAGVVLALLLAVAATIVAIRFATGPQAGTLVIDAAPWGTITAIETQNGDRLSLPPAASTPLSISLPAGSYQVTVTGPPPESQTQRLTVRVDPGGANVAPLARFNVMTPEEYFEPYLATPSSSAEPVAPPPDNASVAEPQPPAQPATAQTPVPAGGNR